MQARQIIGNAAFGPEALKIVFEAYDEAWKSIEGNFGGDPAALEAARARLAETILALAREGASDPQSLKDAALQAIALDYNRQIK